MSDEKEIDTLLNKEDEERNEGEDKEEEYEGEEEEYDEEYDEELSTPLESEDQKKDRWYGKSREEVIRAFEEQEKKIKDLETKLAEKKEEKEEIEGKEEIGIPSDEEFQQMTPREFALWVLTMIKTESGKIFEEKSIAKETALQEIREAKKNHPLLETSAEFQELVLALIKVAAQEGKYLSLEDACKKVEAFAGKKEGKTTEEEELRLKKAKAQLESGKGVPSAWKEEKEEEQKRVERIFRTETPQSSLGGLGI